MVGKKDSLTEVKLGFLMPAFLVFGILLNLAITHPPEIELDGFAEVAIRPGSPASYQQDLGAPDFPPVDSDIVSDVRRDSGPSPEGQEPLLASPTPSPTGPAPTDASGLVPTVVSIVPTLVPDIVPTVVSIVPTLVPEIVPTVVSIVPTVVSDTVDTVETLVSPLLPSTP